MVACAEVAVFWSSLVFLDVFVEWIRQLGVVVKMWMAVLLFVEGCVGRSCVGVFDCVAVDGPWFVGLTAFG